LREGGIVAQNRSTVVERINVSAVVEPVALDDLIGALRRRGFRVLGPTVRDGAIVYDELERAADLPVGWTDRQEAGTYRLERREDDARFGYAVGPHSWKQFLFPARLRLWRAHTTGSAPVIEEEPVDETPLAFIGVRACELNAIAIQDRVFTGGKFVDRDYAARRRGIFVVAVNCGEPAGTCFCVSMAAGPRVEQGFDLALTEVLEGEHRFLVEAGSPAGEEVLAELSSRPAAEADVAAARAVVDSAAARMGRTMESADLRDLLADNLEHPRWDEVAERCLTCGNCTMVCPTCFCSSVEDTTDLAGAETARTRVWDTCFSLDYSYIHGGSVRASARSRYRQWLTHKLGTWHDQFDTSGCVGCGRCITWCPVGIDITEEVAALRGEEADDAAPA
jgi:sulfhydrogenase subunit beta (sulfur reductase)